MNWIASFSMALLGMLALSLAMPRHHRQVRGGHLPSATLRNALRGGGVMLIAASLWHAAHMHGIGIGLVVWCAMLCAAGIAVAWLLPYRPRAVPFAAALGIVGTFSGLWG